MAWTEPLAGFTVAVATDRRRDPLVYLLARQGARVVPTWVPTSRWAPTAGRAPLRRLVNLIGGRLVDAVTFNAAVVVQSVLDAGSTPVLDRLRDEVTAACVEPAVAKPLVAQGVPVLVPDRPRSGALVDALVAELPRHTTTVKVAGARVTLRGHAALVDDSLRALSPGPMAVLRALAGANGAVLSRTALRQVLPRGGDEHTVDMAVLRLRAGLGNSSLVETVVRRGYRLPLD
jgi:uroporphyrinogen-III synthase